MSSITPTISRKIWYTPTMEDIALGMVLSGTTSHVDATIVYVDEAQDLVNLRITDHAGNTFVRHGVAVVDDAQPGSAHWMPFQKGQAQQQQASEAAISNVVAELGTQPVTLRPTSLDIGAAHAAEAAAARNEDTSGTLAEIGGYQQAESQANYGAQQSSDASGFVDISQYQGRAPEGVVIGEQLHNGEPLPTESPVQSSDTVAPVVSE